MKRTRSDVTTPEKALEALQAEKRQKLESELNAATRKKEKASSDLQKYTNEESAIQVKLSELSQNPQDNPDLLNQKINELELKLTEITTKNKALRKTIKEAQNEITKKYHEAIEQGQEAQPICTTEWGIILEARVEQAPLKNTYDPLKKEYDIYVAYRDKDQTQQPSANNPHLLWHDSSSLSTQGKSQSQSAIAGNESPSLPTENPLLSSLSSA